MSAALAAAQAGNLGVGFSGAGFLIYFYFGVVDVLQRQLGVIKRDMPQAGASSGSLILLTTYGLVPLDVMMREADRLAEYCRSNGACLGSLEGQIRGLADRVVPMDIPFSNNVYISVTSPARDGGAPPQTRLINQFSGRQDLLDAGVASCYIPFVAGPRLTTTFRGEQFYDGSFNGNGQGWLPCPPVGHCIRISSMPAGLKLGELLRSSLGYEQKIRTASLLATALPNVPAASISMAAAYTTNGGAFQADAAAAGSFFSALQQLVTPGEGEADVFPGRRHPLPTNAFIWASYLLSAADPGQNMAIYELGQKEAWSWAEENGFVPAGKTLTVGAPPKSSTAAPSLAPLPAVTADITAGTSGGNSRFLR